MLYIAEKYGQFNSPAEVRVRMWCTAHRRCTTWVVRMCVMEFAGCGSGVEGVACGIEEVACGFVCAAHKPRRTWVVGVVGVALGAAGSVGSTWGLVWGAGGRHSQPR